MKASPMRPERNTYRLSLCALLLLVAAGALSAPLSHLSLHAMALPPAGLTDSLVGGEPTLKGMSPAAEQALLNALNGAGLQERVLRVAVAEHDGVSVALIKVQAGDAQSRLFTLQGVEHDAMRALAIAFDTLPRVQHVDFWSVVPEVVADGSLWHRPVFSVTAGRFYFRQVAGSRDRSERELLASLSAVRYDPVFTKHASDWPGAEASMPRTAYTFLRLADEWRGLVTEGAEFVARPESNPATISVVLGGVANGGKVALTIDDGPHPLITPLFLDILRRENVHATFFVVGEKAEEFPGLIREIARDGHELANHTYSHQRFSTLPPEEVYAQLRGCSKIVAALTGKRMQFVRPPGGDYDAASLRVSEALGLTTALWTHNTGDWARPEPTAIAYNATHALASGDIILMHQGDMKSVQALPMIIDRVRARNLEPSTLSSIAGNGATSRLSPGQAVAQRARLRLTE